jgi:hypothetical protein
MTAGLDVPPAVLALLGERNFLRTARRSTSKRASVAPSGPVTYALALTLT